MGFGKNKVKQTVTRTLNEYMVCITTEEHKFEKTKFSLYRLNSMGK